MIIIEIAKIFLLNLSTDRINYVFFFIFLLMENLMVQNKEISKNWEILIFLHRNSSYNCIYYQMTEKG